MFAGLAALLVIMITAWAPWRRRPPASQPAAAGPSAAPGSLEPAGPERTGPAIWGIRRPVAVTGLVLAALAGLWVGGYLAALLVPAGTAVFLAAGQSRAGSRFARLASPWLAAGLLVAASACVAVGSPLSGGPGTLLSRSLPQLLCLAVVARLIAALLGESRAADRTGSAQAKEAAQARRPSG